MKTTIIPVTVLLTLMFQPLLLTAESASPVFTNSLQMPFVKVPGTKVLFSIWDTRVQDYQTFIKATGAVWAGLEAGQGATHPAVNVNWNDARAFCQWLTAKERKEGRIGASQSYRLPTDVEWSAAAGLKEAASGTPEEKDGKVENLFPWGAQWPPQNGAGNFSKSLHVDNFESTSPVGSFPANQFGLYDMAGNVSQWTEDWYNGKQKERALRGSGWASDSSSSLWSSSRGYLKPGYSGLAIGFRCVLTDAQ
jgi:formylglycine-generating enzyme required for sulfatase activity